MSERIGSEVLSDGPLLTYARDLWASASFVAWRDHMRQDVEAYCPTEGTPPPSQ